MLTKEISEVKKEIEEYKKAETLKESCKDYFYKKFKDNWEDEFYKQHLKNIESECDYLDFKKKLSTLKSAQQKFNGFVEDLKTDSEIDGLDLEYRPHKKRFIERIDELSSKQENSK